MRDVLITLLIGLALPLMVWRPPWGVLAWAWFGIMNPHRLAWGFATSLPFAQAIGLATLVGALFSKEPKALKGGAATVVLFLFVAYAAFTTIFALIPDRAWPMLDRVVKIQLGTILALTLLYRREHVIALIWVVAGSIGFYAVKGGLFTIVTLGEFRVWGPGQSFISDNNAFALATVMSIPLWVYLYIQYRSARLLRIGIAAAIALSVVSAAGSHSRGAVLAAVAMGLFLWAKSRKKLAAGFLLALMAAATLTLMPQKWEERLATITAPTQEASANSRLETWKMLWNLALDRPLTGGGFETYSRAIFQRYNPSYPGSHAAHSIYFQVLGEHGFVGLALFLVFWALVWRMCSQVAALTRARPELDWAYWLAQMVKVSLVAYLVGGAFLNLAYWDAPYYLFVAIAVTRCQVRACAFETSAAASPEAKEGVDIRIDSPAAAKVEST